VAIKKTIDSQQGTFDFGHHDLKRTPTRIQPKANVLSLVHTKKIDSKFNIDAKEQELVRRILKRIDHLT
jgi:hypothetical protein